MLLHILLFDRAYSLTHWVNYAETRARLRRRFHTAEVPSAEFRDLGASRALLGIRLRQTPGSELQPRGQTLGQQAPQTAARSFAVSPQADSPVLAALGQGEHPGAAAVAVLKAGIS